MLKNPANNIQNNEIIMETKVALLMHVKDDHANEGIHSLPCEERPSTYSAVNLDHHNTKATNQYLLH